MNFWEISLEPGVELRKVDPQGRVVLPPDWRKEEIPDGREVFIIKREGSLKILPKRRIDLTKFFDEVDIGVDSVGDWEEFEKKFYGARE